MPWLPRVRFRLRTLFGRQWLEQQLDEELQFHLEMQTAAHMRVGMSLPAARAMARREFGSVAQHKDDYRDRWGVRRLEEIAQDVRSGIRQVWTYRLTSGAIVLALALGIGVSTAVFSVFDAVVLQPPPFDRPEGLVRLQAAARGGERLFSAPEIRDLRREASSLSSVAEFHFMYFILLDGQEPRRVSAGVVSANFFDVIGVPPVMGRAFHVSEEAPGAPGVIILSHRYWTDELGADPHVIGRVFQMNDRPHTVVGVLPALPSFPEEADIYLPTSACPLRISDAGNLDRTNHLVSALGRIAPGVTNPIDTVRGDLVSAAGRIGSRYPGDYDSARAFSVSAVAVNDDLTWRFRPTMAVLIASAGFLLLSLCSSIGALLLARSLRRRRNVAMQIALGAWRGRLFQQFATESLLLTVAGAVAGLVCAHAALPWLVALASRYTSRADEIALSQTAIGFAVAVSVCMAAVCGAIVLFTAAPRGNRPGVPAGPADVARDPAFRALVVVQIAVSFALLVGAGLTLTSVSNLQRVDTGYRSDGVLTMRVSTDFIKYPTPARRTELYDALLRSVRQVPGVADVALSGALPLLESGNVGTVDVGTRTRPGSGAALSSLQVVSPGYFRTVGVRLIAGREFDASDIASSRRVAIVNRTLADDRWPDGNAVGNELRIDSGEWRTVIGVVAAARQRLSEPPMEEVFVPLVQTPPFQARLLVRSHAGAASIDAAVRDAVRRAEPQQPIDSALTLDGARDEAVAPIRVTALLIGAFALIGVTISLIGVAGVVAASVQARTSEIGLQMALGATRERLLRSVLGDGLKLTAAGLALGLLPAALLARALSTLLFEVTPADPLVYSTVALFLVAATLAACLLPARRAARVDPSVALRVG